jgi:hypothetical protein
MIPKTSYHIQTYNKFCHDLNIRLNTIATTELQSNSNDEYECAICRELFTDHKKISPAKKNLEKVPIDLREIGLIAGIALHL